MFKQNHFCLVWKSIAISFNKAIEESKLNFKVVDKVISDKHVINFLQKHINLKKFNHN